MKNKYVPQRKDVSRFAAEYYKKKSDKVIEKDLMYVCSFLCIELYENHGFSTDDLADFLNKVQQRWVDYAGGDNSVSPVELCEEITGIRLFSKG